METTKRGKGVGGSRDDSIGRLNGSSSDDHVDAGMVVSELEGGLQWNQDTVPELCGQDVFDDLLLGGNDVVHVCRFGNLHDGHVVYV